MYSKSLFTAILIRVIFIMISSFAFVAVIPYLNKEYFLSLIGIGIIIIYQIYLLTKYVNKTNQKLAHFFDSIRNEESGLIFSTKHNEKIFDSLDVSLNELNNAVGNMRSKNASQSLFLNDLVEHVGVGLISYTNSGKIEIFNKAAKELLQINRISNINDLNFYSPELSKSITELRPHSQQLVKITTKQSMLFLALKLSIFKSEEETINLLSIQNIRNELEQKELDTWQKLIRVLKHEISNSISPITSLANTTKKYFLKKGTKSLLKIDELEENILNKAVDCLDNIETTGKELINFVEKYRSLTDLPQTKFENFKISETFEKVRTLLYDGANSNNIALEFNTAPSNLEITADVGLLEKVLINLIKNAFQALENSSDGEVNVRAFNNIENRVVIEICDNGPGIPSNIINDIFIPFYTTKEKGSGIGLSLSRQIMRLHKGTIIVKSISNKETIFSLVF